jgi:putative ABC transport system permease protein
MLMSALERTREIGTMMALGVRRARILVLFLLEAALLGLAGGGLGALTGGALVALLGRRPVVVAPPGGIPFRFVPHVAPSYLLGLVALVAAGAVLVSLYPAWRASRLRPVEALAGK